jgi:hypothetical protein
MYTSYDMAAEPENSAARELHPAQSRNIWTSSEVLAPKAAQRSTCVGLQKLAQHVLSDTLE